MLRHDFDGTTSFINQLIDLYADLTLYEDKTLYKWYNIMFYCVAQEVVIISLESLILNLQVPIALSASFLSRLMTSKCFTFVHMCIFFFFSPSLQLSFHWSFMEIELMCLAGQSIEARRTLLSNSLLPCGLQYFLQWCSYGKIAGKLWLFFKITYDLNTKSQCLAEKKHATICNSKKQKHSIFFLSWKGFSGICSTIF